MDTVLTDNLDRLDITGRVREELRGLMEIERYSWDERGALTLRGQLSGPADSLYRAIRARMERLGFTPFLRQRRRRRRAAGLARRDRASNAACLAADRAVPGDDRHSA